MLRPRPEVWLPPEPAEGGIVGEGGVDVAAADAGHRVGTSRARKLIGVGADIGLRQQVADGVIEERLKRHRHGALGHLRHHSLLLDDLPPLLDNQAFQLGWRQAVKIVGRRHTHKESDSRRLGNLIITPPPLLPSYI
jgi:hypothetical protein